MANNFPHVEIIGMDLAPSIMNEDNVPDNCRFELDDVNRGLPHFYDQLDLVHMRQVSSGVSHRRLCPFPQRSFSSNLSQIQSELKHPFSSDNKLRRDC